MFWTSWWTAGDGDGRLRGTELGDGKPLEQGDLRWLCVMTLQRCRLTYVTYVTYAMHLNIYMITYIYIYIWLLITMHNKCRHIRFLCHSYTRLMLWTPWFADNMFETSDLPRMTLFEPCHANMGAVGSCACRFQWRSRSKRDSSQQDLTSASFTSKHSAWLSWLCKASPRHNKQLVKHARTPQANTKVLGSST